jgi:hypothetical protein
MLLLVFLICGFERFVTRGVQKRDKNLANLFSWPPKKVVTYLRRFFFFLPRRPLTGRRVALSHHVATWRTVVRSAAARRGPLSCRGHGTGMGAATHPVRDLGPTGSGLCRGQGAHLGVGVASPVFTHAGSQPFRGRDTVCRLWAGSKPAPCQPVF